MNPQTLEQYLHEHIPLSKSMQVSVIEAEVERVTYSERRLGSQYHPYSVIAPQP
jgi:hypothetical protein